ncbi:hypothetical protein C8T65DRAFT_73769 [Cerioporus squamosus]|nr:hypothetical protein C8T65DRAFT_73769 [Cerioporus squamosus]
MMETRRCGSRPKIPHYTVKERSLPYNDEVQVARGDANVVSIGIEGKMLGLGQRYGELPGLTSNAGHNDNTSNGDFPCPADATRSVPGIPGCFFVNDGGPFVKYAGTWAVSSFDGDGKGSIHQATAPDASVEISFDGTGLALFGIVPPSNQTDPPPTASYTVDKDVSSHRTLPFATECQRNQDFFDVYHLPEGNHTVAITVTAASTSAPYIVDFILLCRTTCTPSASLPMSTTGRNGQSLGHSAGGVIIGATVGGVSLFLGLAILACICIRRKRRTGTRDLQPGCQESCHTTSTDSFNPHIFPTPLDVSLDRASSPVLDGDGTMATIMASSPGPGPPSAPLHAGRCPPESDDTESPPPAYSLV